MVLIDRMVSMPASLRDALRQNKTLIGTLVTTSSPEVAEVLALAGFDWLFIDLEHGSLSMQDAQRVIQVVAGRCFTVVRVPDATAENVKRVLDTGCDGIIAPHVNSADEARQIVALAKYPPDGERSVGLSRAQGYGLNFADYISTANAQTIVIVQIEHKNAVNNIDQILQVQGIDALFIGPYDLSGSMGLLGQVSDTKVVAAIDKVHSACARSNMPLGIFCTTAEQASAAVKTGAHIVAVGTDLMHMANSARTALESIRER
jgi:2-dehydro-3-deoxyglucarate aldolase/4-hydroxy-2-oxoheptanedioate aldolase